MAQVPHSNPTARPGLPDPLAESHRRQAVQQELMAVQQELESVRQLLETLPQVFEGKFEERVGPMLTQRQRLLEQNDQMRQQVLQLQPAEDPSTVGLPRLESSNRPGLGQALRHAFGLQRNSA